MEHERFVLALRGSEESSEAAALGEVALWILVSAAIPWAIFHLIVELDQHFGGTLFSESTWLGM